MIIFENFTHFPNFNTKWLMKKSKKKIPLALVSFLILLFMRREMKPSSPNGSYSISDPELVLVDDELELVVDESVVDESDSKDIAISQSGSLKIKKYY